MVAKQSYFLLLLALSLLPIGLYLYGLFWVDRPTDLEIARSAPEDILGFGFWIPWAIAAIFEAVALIAGYHLAGGSINGRVSVIVIGLVFCVVSFLAYKDHKRLEARVLAGPQSAVSITKPS